MSASGEAPRYPVEEESPRECCANLAVGFRGAAEQARDYPLNAIPFTAEVLGGIASRLERAVRMLDQEKAPPEGPWRIILGAGDTWMILDANSRWLASVLTEAEAIAVRDALNRVSR